MTRSPAAPDVRHGALKVVIIDSHDVARRGVQAIVEDAGFDVVATSAVAVDAAALVEEHQPGVVIYDPHEAPEATALCAALTGMPRAPRILVLTQSAAPSDLYQFVRSGVTGYLLKDCTTADLTSAIRLVSEGQTVVAPQLAAALVAEMTHEAERATDRSGLTERESQVLGLVARGLSNRDVARELQLAENTVKNHVRSILEKLGVRSRVEATLFAIKSGLVDPN